MPTIKTRKQTDGTTRYTAIVRIRRGGVILHRESRTFAHRSAALKELVPFRFRFFIGFRDASTADTLR